jgi:crotonobetainyl-CoA:carnitine CoA-transferase CaiB-like acyl-CoA transferase
MKGSETMQGTTNATGVSAGPLAHIKVLDLTIARAGPTCVRVLADHGAQVIQVVRPEQIRKSC